MPHVTPAPGGGGALTDGSVTPRLLSDLSRTGGWVPTGAIAETIRARAVNSNVSPTTGQLYVAGGMVLPGGRAVSSITFMSDTTAAVTPTNQWFCLLDQSRNVLATTVDDTTAAWGSNAVKTLLLATTIGGATPGGTYTPANALEVYVGINVVAATTPNIKAIAVTTPLAGLAPKIAGTIGAASAFTGPITTNPGTVTETTRILYAYVS